MIHLLLKSLYNKIHYPAKFSSPKKMFYQNKSIDNYKQIFIFIFTFELSVQMFDNTTQILLSLDEDYKL